MFYLQARDMNDKGKGKATKTAPPPSTTVSDVFSPMPPALSKKLDMLSEGKGKSKEKDEPLPGKFPFVSSQYWVTNSSDTRIFQV